MANYLNRRDFIAFSALAAAMLALPGCATLPKRPRKPRPIAKGAKIRIAQIGCGGKGFSDIMPHKDEEVVALCDIDWDLKVMRQGEAHFPVRELFAEFPNAKRYRDYRKMLTEMDDQIDAVCVSTPDHMHFLPAYMAIMLGKHVYIQKPLTQTIGEARELLRLARMNGVVTQMGNQGHAGEGIRLVREWFQAGLLGDVRDVQIWTNRPIWPQGMTTPPPDEPTPAGVAWDTFLGRAPARGFSSKIHPFNWRGYHDYGCGALGDMACHLMDAAFWNLNLGAPTSVEPLKINGSSSFAFPNSAIVEYQFPARGALPPVKLTWYEGSLKPERPAQFGKDAQGKERELAKGGQLLIGSKATVYDGNDYCNSPRFIPEELHRQLAPSFPPKSVPRVPDANPHKEWTAAIRANNPQGCGSNFEYSVPFTEMVCLGTMAILAGKKFTWDAEKMTTGQPDVDRLLYPTYRAGWKPTELSA